MLLDKKFTKAKLLAIRNANKDVDAWVKDANEQSNKNLMNEIDKENEKLDRDEYGVDVEEGDFGHDFDYEADDEDDDSNINGDL